MASITIFITIIIVIIPIKIIVQLSTRIVIRDTNITNDDKKCNTNATDSNNKTILILIIITIITLKI